MTYQFHDEDAIEVCRICGLETAFGSCDDDMRCPVCSELHRLEVAS